MEDIIDFQPLSQPSSSNTQTPRPAPSTPPAQANKMASSSANPTTTIGKTRKNKIKRQKRKERLKMKIREEPGKKQVASATRLAARLASTQITRVTPFSTASLATNRTGFAASLQDASKAKLAHIRNDHAYRSRILKMLHPIPYKYVLC